MRAKLPKVMSGRMWCRGSKNIGEEWMPNRMVYKTSNKPSYIFKLDIKYQNKNIHRKKRHWECQNVLSHGRKRTNHSSCRKSTHDHAPQYRTRVEDMRNILFFTTPTWKGTCTSLFVFRMKLTGDSYPCATGFKNCIYVRWACAFSTIFPHFGTFSIPKQTIAATAHAKNIFAQKRGKTFLPKQDNEDHVSEIEHL